MRPTPLDVAGEMVGRGFSVFPIRTQDKKPAIKWKAFQTRRPTSDELKGWFGNGQRFNVGIATGAISGIVVVDADSGEAEAWAQEHLPATPMITRTARGRHRYFAHPGVPVRNRAKLRTDNGKIDIDIRADGGYVMAPGSVHPDGHLYVCDSEWPESLEALPKFDPAWIAPPERPSPPPIRATSTTHDTAMRRARAYLAATPPAIEGQGGDTHTYQVVCRIVRGFDLADADAFTLLSEWNTRCSPPWSDVELDAKIRGARAYGDEPIGGRLDDRAIPSTVGIAPVGTHADGDVPTHRTDTGNATRFVRMHRDSLLYCFPLNTWFVFDGHAWQPDTTGEVMRKAKTTVATIYSEVATVLDEKQRKALAGWALQSENEKRLNAMVSLARSELPVSPDELDAHPWLFNVLNGTIDLRTGKAHAHRASDRLTKLAPVEYDPEARSELWERVLEHALPNKETRRFFQKLAGYTCCGETGEDVAAVLYGPTRTAKGTVQEGLSATLGDYAITAELDLLAERDRPGCGPRPELVRLRGARMVSIYETSRRLKLSASLVKSLAGSDPITARDLHAKPITFRPQATLWLATNYRPHAPTDDDALWERIRELSFDVIVPEDRRDPAVRAALRDPAAHGSAILAWAVQGCLLWQTEGLRQPEAVRAATLDYRAEMDPLAGFLNDACVLRPSAWTPSERLRAEYERWAKESGERPISGAQFREGLRRHGCAAKRRHAGRGWCGIGLVTSIEDDTEHDRDPVTVDRGDPHKFSLSLSHEGTNTKSRHEASHRHGHGDEEADGYASF